MCVIREYRDSDYEMLRSWWEVQGEPAPTRNLIPKDSTFILEISGDPILSISAYMTNVKGMSYLENFIGNPQYKEDRSKHSSIIVEHAVTFLKNKGYERVVCFSYKDKLKKRYEELGMKKTLNNLSSFVREIK